MDDITLSETGLAPAGSGRILLIACGALAHEILALKAANGWSHLDLQCLPGEAAPLARDRIIPAVEAAVAENRGAIRPSSSSMPTAERAGFLQAACDRLGVEMVAGPHCYSFFEGNAAFATRTETEFTAFYLTDFLVRQFDAFVWKPMGLDRHPELRDMYFRQLHQACLSGAGQ